MIGSKEAQVIAIHASNAAPPPAGRSATPSHRLRRTGPVTTYPLNPIFLCVPSQNGLFFEPPQRQSHVCVPRQRSSPLPATSVRFPMTLSGPSFSGLISSLPPSTVKPSPSSPTAPESLNSAASWLLSQKGFRCDRPHRQSA